MLSNDAKPGLSLVQLPKKQKMMDVYCRTLRCKRESGIRRMTALSFAKNIREVDSPSVRLSNGDTIVAHNTNDGFFVFRSEHDSNRYEAFAPLSTLSDSDSDKDSEADSDLNSEPTYSVTPLARAILLFQTCLNEQKARLDSEKCTENDSEDWVNGGVAHRSTAKFMHVDPVTAKRCIDHQIHSELSSEKTN